jgi:Serpentine type 7TM GPCR chemoreceptor Srw
MADTELSAYSMLHDRESVPPRGWAWPASDGDNGNGTIRHPSAVNHALQICNGSQSPDTDECVRPLLLASMWLDYPVYGILAPAVIAFTVVTNSLVCVVLLRPNMRSATNVLLVAMALSDMLTGVWPLPCYINFYTLGRAADYVPYNWCFVYHCLTEYLPIVCHTASIWLTVGLAVHR